MLRIGPQLATWASPAWIVVASPAWIAVASAALLTAVVCALAFRRSAKGFVSAATRFVLIVLAAMLSGSLVWAIDAGRERNVLEGRAAQLTTQALLPGSALACLDASTGDTVQEACQPTLFVSAASVASAVAYVAEQFVLLSDMTEYDRRKGASIDGVLVPLRRALEADPFGLLAHVLVTRGCTSEHCPQLALLHDARQVRTNIIAQTFDHYVDHYRAVWARASDTSGGPPADAAAADGKRKVPVDIDFPTAASIPPVSIMNPEPRAPNPEAVRKEKSQTGVDPVWTPAPAQAAK